MTFDEYQQKSLETVIKHDSDEMTKTIWVLGMAGETGEVVEKWKKIVANKNGQVTDEDRKEITKELGDVLWYMSTFAHDLGISFEEIAQVNLAKLASRKERKLIHGDGDNR